MRWLYKSAILTAGRFGPPAAIYLSGALHYKTDLVAAYALAVNSGQISAQLSECGLSARLARVGTGHLTPYWRVVAGRVVLLALIAAVALEMNWASLVDVPIAFGVLMLTLVRDVALIERDALLQGVDALCGVLSLAVFSLPLGRAAFLWSIAVIYVAAGLMIMWHLFRARPAHEPTAAASAPAVSPQNYSDWASYINRVMGLLVSGFDVQLIARVGLGSAALTRYLAARSVLQIGAVAAAYGQALVGARVHLVRSAARPQAIAMRTLAVILAVQVILLVYAYEPRLEVSYLLAAFTLAAAWTVIYSVYLPIFAQRGMNQAVLLASLLANVAGFTVMLLTWRKLGVAGVACGVAVTKFVYCEMVVRDVARHTRAGESSS
jgi:hypothetical protein